MKLFEKLERVQTFDVKKYKVKKTCAVIIKLPWYLKPFSKWIEVYFMPNIYDYEGAESEFLSSYASILGQIPTPKRLVKIHEIA